MTQVMLIMCNTNTLPHTNPCTTSELPIVSHYKVLPRAPKRCCSALQYN